MQIGVTKGSFLSAFYAITKKFGGDAVNAAGCRVPVEQVGTYSTSISLKTEAQPV